jgi:hypothetical protein
VLRRRVRLYRMPANAEVSREVRATKSSEDLEEKHDGAKRTERGRALEAV